MEFGRVTNIDEINFHLPPTHKLSEETLAKLNSPSNSNSALSQKLFIGCPVWADKGYVGKIYPRGTSSKNYLKEYCKQFNAIEVNATHYQIPSENTIQKWKEAATPGFKFCPKFPQLISHRNDFDNKQEWLDLFLSSIYQLDEFLGTSFIQFPPHFKPNKLEQLNNFFNQLPHDMDFAVEFRNQEWFESDSILKEWFELLSKHKIIPVITDTSGRRDVLHQLITREKVFIRFTGNNLHPTDYLRIKDWTQLLLNWFDQGLSEAYFFVHEPEKHLCADIATYMIELLKDKKQFQLKAPRIYSEKTGSLF